MGKLRVAWFSISLKQHQVSAQAIPMVLTRQ